MAVFTDADRIRMEKLASERNPNIFVQTSGASQKVEGKEMGNTAWVMVTENGKTYHVYLPTEGQADNVRKALTACQTNLRLSGAPLNAAELAAEFVAKVRSNTNCRAVFFQPSYFGEKPFVDFTYEVGVMGGRVFNVKVTERLSGTTFNGTYNAWLGHTSLQKRLSAFAKTNKVVSFKYDGGTKPGERRLVRVEKVDATHIYGTDVEQGEPRSFLLNKVVNGEISVV